MDGAGDALIVEARARAVQGTAQFLPDGLDTTRHHLLIAANAAGVPVGNAWVGPDPYRPSALDSAWLYDINVYPDADGRGTGRPSCTRSRRYSAPKGGSSSA